jgi:N-acetylglucosaminyldiphosphoundecaprenol N-acetyl-beta-D-mannosaminyltransferase
MPWNNSETLAPNRLTDTKRIPGRCSVLGTYVSLVDHVQAVERILWAAVNRQPLAVTALAVHGVMLAWMDRALQHRINSLDLVTPESIGVTIALRMLANAKLTTPTDGTTLMLEICERAAEMQLPIYLYGSRQEVVSALARNLQARYPALIIAGAEPSAFGYLSETERDLLRKRMAASGARVIFVGLGCPRQEIFVYENSASINCPTFAVGAAFDFHAGFLYYPSAFAGRCGLRWLFRLIQEPRRLWRRNLLNPLFLLLVVLQKLRILPPGTENQPTVTETYVG